MKHWTVIFLISLYFLRIFASNPASVRPSTSPKDKLPLPGFAASWLDDRNAFRAGDIAMIKIKFIDFISNETDLLFDSYKVNFSLVVGGKMGNSSYVSGVLSYFEGDPSYWNITFIPFSEGEFNVVIMEEYSGITDSSLHFRVTAGDIYYPACIALWMNPMNEFISGTKVTVLILPKDAFGNNITSRMEGSDSYNFTVAAYFLNGSVANLLGIRYTGWNGLSYIGIEFIPTTAGDLFLHVLGENHTINDSPLPLKVKSGSLDISKSWGSWKYESNSLQIFSRLEFLVYQQDQFGNLVPGFYPFDARIVQKETNLSIPVGDLFFKEMTDGIQMLSFVVSEPGEFSLTIFDVVGNQSISKTPYDFKVFVGYCDGSNSVVNGSGLVSSVAGRMSSFTVYLEDMYHNPSPVEAEMLHVQILRRNDSTNVRPVIFPLRNFDESRPSAGHKHLVSGPDSTVPGLPISQNNTFAAGLKTRTSAFNVAYIPKKSGSYEISVLCGNIPLNGGHPYAMEASPGRVDISLSGVVEFSPRVKRLFRNGVVVRLMDSFTNPLPSQQTKLSFKIDTANNSSFLRWKFVDNGEGLYTGYYLSRDLGTYKLCISVDDVHLSPCPFEVNVYPREYFPEAHNDSISVWEDESVAFDVLENDYFASGHSSIIDSSIPLHGSLLLYGQLFRYTPYKGFFGNDSFSYTISDINKNLATGTALVSVLCKPPQFVSLPARLQVTEDVIGPKFGGFTGFSVRYSNTMENISVTIGAQFGTVLLAPMPLSHWHPLGNRLSISRGGNTGKDLIVAGNVQLINSALQLIQYLGNEDFYGNDIISLHARNRNGMQDAHVPIFVEPVNDPPFIHAPEFIILERNETSDILQIFRKQNDTFEFSIGDPDHLNFPGNTSDFGVMLSMEVNDGILTTRLPSYLIRTVELKLMNSHQWQHLQTFVTISNHFIAKGKGIRIRGTVEDCNNALEQLLYKGVELGAVLTVSVNDMGNYGCCPDCNVRISMPLFTEVRINLIKRRPISSMTARLLGAAIIVEFIVMLILGGLLLFFICKCTNALHRESRRHSSSDIELSNLEDFSKPTLNAPYENVTYFTGHSSPFFMRTQLSNFRQRSRRVSGSGESSQHKPPLSSKFAADNEQGSSPNSFSPFSMISAKRNST